MVIGGPHLLLGAGERRGNLQGDLLLDGLGRGQPGVACRNEKHAAHTQPPMLRARSHARVCVVRLGTGDGSAAGACGAEVLGVQAGDSLLVAGEGGREIRPQLEGLHRKPLADQLVQPAAGLGGHDEPVVRAPRKGRGRGGLRQPIFRGLERAHRVWTIAATAP